MLLSGLGPLLPRVAASLRRTVPAAVTAAAVVCRPAGPLAAQRWYADRAAGSHQLKEAAQKPRRQRSPKPSGDLKNLVKPDRQNPSPRLGNTATVDFLKRLDREFSGFSMPQPAEPPGPKVLVLAGPTGIGKSQMALDLVKFGHIPNGEIVSADVFQAYSGLHIGTSTPPPEFFEQVPHHLFGFVDPNETMNSSDYYQRTLQTIEDIVARGGTPIIVGGAGFYLQNILLGGLSGVPRSDPETRAKVAQMLEADSNWSKSTLVG
ncbi:hypothetical protein H696_02122 [Fonticula alba]|uniref:tRNA dimethylallyltransferase n=1 Tax=Fonticula alba TaxID=691883 RepID=A0A058ZA86_FONAL|nr:hypothetical protein H696_02122 [Fonticula alba]KCV71170.1 hypothetical protein H696_02122 [Fonticula alba]|eukprot:XP_009494293.1 hypothetical protein H696_02122 [Fonticula alba]